MIKMISTDLSEFMRPHVCGMPCLIKALNCFVVRMRQFDNEQNRDAGGAMIWPEVLVCDTEESAELLRDFLNIKSYHDSREMWIEGEPYLTERELKDRWLKEDVAQYVVEPTENLARHPEIYRICESLMVAGELFPELNFKIGDV